jgi:glutamate---cysteine ligase / carboxylate-amine ligase
MAQPSPSSAELAAAFDAAPAFTVGIEEELLLLDPVSLEPASRALDLLARLEGDARFKAELPSSQLEIVTTPQADVRGAIAELEAGRRELAERVRGEVRLAAAGVSPLGSGVGELNPLERYARTRQEYGPIARRQLVCALQVHIAVSGAEAALAVYNAARSYLPLIAALAANAAVYEGRDTGLASVRSKLGELLPRQGVPPAIDGWEDYAGALRWGIESGSFPEPGAWWWELRPHPRYGTLEFRVPDSQRTISDAAAIAAVIQALVVWLAESEAGAAQAAVPTWRIEENRWSACRHGVEGSMADLETGAVRSTRWRLNGLLEALAPVAGRLGSTSLLDHAAEMVEVNGAITQRQIMREEGAVAVARHLTQGFLEPWAG